MSSSWTMMRSATLEDLPGGGLTSFTYEGRFAANALLLLDGRVVVVGGLGRGTIDARETFTSEGAFP